MGPWQGDFKNYPAWRYHKLLEPVIVKDTAEDEHYQELGYQKQWAPIIASKHLINWYWDLEDMSPNQLVVYAREEYGVDLPVDARQESLLKAILDLCKHAPQNQGRMALMTHTMQMNLDETMAEIRRVTENPTEVITEVIEI